MLPTLEFIDESDLGEETRIEGPHGYRDVKILVFF